MRAPTAAELLDTWQDAVAAPPAWRAQALLQLGFPDLDAGAAVALTVGQRDASLMRLRRHLFGAQLDMVTACPHCQEPLESALDLDALAGAEAVADTTPAPLQAGGYRVAFRPPCCADLLALAGEQDPGAIRAMLLQRCVTGVDTADGCGAAADLPEDVVRAVADAMAAADPAADLELAFDCPACGHSWTACFDVAAFLWREVHAWALRTLRDVHSLALAYGWREADVLALSPARRQIYLELCRI